MARAEREDAAGIQVGGCKMSISKVTLRCMYKETDAGHSVENIFRKM